MQARLRRDFDAVVEIGNRILTADTRSTSVRRALARQFDERANPEDAFEHWLAIRDANPSDFEAPFHLARIYADDGASLDAAIAKAAPDTSEIFRKHLLAVFEDGLLNNSQATDLELHNVVICGVSYSGSTLLDRLLGGLPGVASIGESHWLTKAKHSDGYGPIDFTTDEPDKVVPCSYCGLKCSVLDFAFRRRLAADHTAWYFKIAKRLGTKTLISADKNSPKLVEHDPLLRFDSLVVFKSLPQAWYSELKKRKKGESESYYVEECRKYVGVWINSYRAFLQDFAPAGRVVFLSFEEFAERPREVLENVTRSLSLDFDETVLRSIRPGHAVGGNAQAIAKLRRTDYAPDIAPLESPDLPTAHRQLIDASDEAGYIFEQLQAAHRLTISAK